MSKKSMDVTHKEANQFNEEMRRADAHVKRDVEEIIEQDLLDEHKHDFLWEILDGDDTKYKILSSLSGLLSENGSKNLLYQVVFLRKYGVYTPVVILSNSEILKVKDRVQDLKEKHAKKEKETGKAIKLEISPDQRYHYFKHNKIFYKFANRLLWADEHNINTVSNKIVDYVLNEKVFTKDLYNDFRSKRTEYYWHPDDLIHDIHTAIDISSYFYQALGRTVYHIYLGDQGTGKSVGIVLSSLLQHNAWIGGSTTVPAAVRLIHLYGISLCQDEFEKMSKENRVNFVGVMNNGFNRTGRYTITNMGVKDVSRQVISFRNFSPKCFTCNSLRMFDYSFLDRCFITRSVLQQKHTEDIYQLSQRDLQVFQSLRDKMFVFCLFNWEDITVMIDKVKSSLEEANIFGRESDKISIIIGIITYFKGESYANRVKEFIGNMSPIWQLEHVQSLEGSVLSTIVSYYDEQSASLIKIPNLIIYQNLLDDLGLTEGDKYAPSNQKPRRILEGLGLLRSKSNLGYTSDGARAFIINVGELKNVLEKGKYKELLKNLLAKNLSDYSDPPNPSVKNTDRSDRSGKSEGILANKKIRKTVQIDAKTNKTINNKK